MDSYGIFDHQQPQARHNHFDPMEFFDRQKEIDGILSNAFDDLATTSQLSDKDDDDSLFNDNNQNILMKTDKLKNNNDLKSCFNGVLTSTPYNHQFNGSRKKNSKMNHNKYSDILEENSTTNDDIESIPNDLEDNTEFELHSSLSLSDHENGDNLFCPHSKINKKQLTNGQFISETLIDENDSPLEDLSFLKKEFSKMNSNYEALQNSYKQLDYININNLNTIETLRIRVKALERQLQNEQKSKESERQKADIFESKVSDLEYQLNEMKKGDYLTRNSEEQMKVFEAMKIKHQNALHDLRTEYDSKIEKLLDRIHKKDDELIASCESVQKFRQESHYYQKKIQEMQKKFESEIKKIKEETELKLLQSFDQSMEKLKIDWNQKLEEDIAKIVEWFENKENSQNDVATNFDVRFEKLIELCQMIKKFQIQREQQVQRQIQRMEEAKFQLERALIESRIRNSSLSSASSRSDLLSDDNEKSSKLMASKKSNLENGLKTKPVNKNNDNLGHDDSLVKKITNLKLKYEKNLFDVREKLENEIGFLQQKLLDKEHENNQLEHKLKKYKIHYRMLLNKNKHDLELLKNHFSLVLQDFIENKTISR